MKKFQETQNFTQKWLFVPIYGVFFLFVYGLIKQIFLHAPFGNNPLSNTALVSIVIMLFLLIVLLHSLQMQTLIDENGIVVNFRPFKKYIKWTEVNNLSMIQYDFVGYGIRYGSKYGTVYNTKGNKGLSIQLKNGNKLLVGTQNAEELKICVQDWQINHLHND